MDIAKLKQEIETTKPDVIVLSRQDFKQLFNHLVQYVFDPVQVKSFEWCGVKVVQFEFSPEKGHPLPPQKTNWGESIFASVDIPKATSTRDDSLDSMMYHYMRTRTGV